MPDLGTIGAAAVQAFGAAELDPMVRATARLPRITGLERRAARHGAEIIPAA